MFKLLNFLSNKYIIMGLVALVGGGVLFGSVSYYKHKISLLNEKLITIKNECEVAKSELNYKIYQLEKYKKETGDLIDKQNKEIDKLNKKLIEQRGQIAQYVIKYDNVKKEKQKLIEQYRIDDNESLEVINNNANKLLKEILWAN